MAVSPRQLFSLERQYDFYIGYHKHPVNQAIHLVFIPTIAISGLIFLTHVKLPAPAALQALDPDLALLSSLLYWLYYLLLDLRVGLASSPLLLAYLALARAAALRLTLRAAFVAQAVGWGAQLVGHYYFEKRAPAFTESVVQSFLVAPLFVFLELFFAAGLFPELQARLSIYRQKKPE